MLCFILKDMRHSVWAVLGIVCRVWNVCKQCACAEWPPGSGGALSWSVTSGPRPRGELWMKVWSSVAKRCCYVGCHPETLNISSRYFKWEILDRSLWVRLRIPAQTAALTRARMISSKLGRGVPSPWPKFMETGRETEAESVQTVQNLFWVDRAGGGKLKGECENSCAFLETDRANTVDYLQKQLL